MEIQTEVLASVRDTVFTDLVDHFGEQDLSQEDDHAWQSACEITKWSFLTNYAASPRSALYWTLRQRERGLPKAHTDKEHLVDGRVIVLIVLINNHACHTDFILPFPYWSGNPDITKFWYNLISLGLMQGVYYDESPLYTPSPNIRGVHTPTPPPLRPWACPVKSLDAVILIHVPRTLLWTGSNYLHINC